MNVNTEIKLNPNYYKEVDGVIHKKCYKCGKYQPLTKEFYNRNRSRRTGFDSRACKPCRLKGRGKIEHYDEFGNLRCSKCGEYKPIENFYKNSVITKNLRLRDGYAIHCSDCLSIFQKNRRIRIKNSDKETREFYSIKELVRGAKGRAKKKGRVFEIDETYIRELLVLQNHKCAISGIDLTTSFGEGWSKTSISIDRIDSSIGYTKDNVHLVCDQVNRMKNTLSTKELIALCKQVIEYQTKLNAI